MQPELKKTYVTAIPDSKFVGRCYREEEKQNGTFAHIWGEWFAQNLFEPIENLLDDSLCMEDKEAYYGLCRIKDNTSYEYWIGMIVPKDSVVSEGYDSFPISACDGIVNWVYGKEPDIYAYCCLDAMAKLGYRWEENADGERIMTERYVCPRFTTPDAEGNCILDLVYFTNYR